VENAWLFGGHGATFFLQGSLLCGRCCQRSLGSLVGLVVDSWLSGGHGPKFLALW
jgi:hypothetical protein